MSHLYSEMPQVACCRCVPLWLHPRARVWFWHIRICSLGRQRGNLVLKPMTSETKGRNSELTVLSREDEFYVNSLANMKMF